MSERPALAAARARLAAKAGPVSAAAIDKDAQRGAPTTEQGSPGMVLSGLGGFGGTMGAPGWSYFVDDREYALELQWPQSVEKYERMEMSDAQIKGLMLATTLPIRRFRWEIDPNEADQNVIDLIAEDLNLPIRGEDPRPRRRGGFNHDRHLGHALRALGQGHYHFEELVEYRDDGLFHLKKLGTRPPRSIIGIRTDQHGELEAIEQMAGGFPTAGRTLGGITGLGVRTLKANRLLTYLWDTADDGDQVGRSMLRACYRDWVVKDALIRVDAVKHERNAMGIPWFEVDPAASESQIQSLAQRAEEIRASTVGGGAGPGKLRIAGVEGTLPDTIGSIRYHDEQMAKTFMLLLMNLGGDANSGARALGDTFAEWYLDMQGAIADWYVEATQAFIDRQVQRNFGPDVQAPLIAYTRLETAELAFADLALGVKEGLIAVGPELGAYIGERWKLPGQENGPEPAAPTPAALVPGEGGEVPGEGPAASESAGAPQNGRSKEKVQAQPKRSALADKLLTTLTAPMTWPQLAKAAGTDAKNGTARRARDLLMAEGAIYKRAGDGTLAPAVALSLPERDLKRAPLPFEVTAQVDFATMEDTYTQGRASLIDTYRAAQSAQIDQLVAEVEAAEGDATALATLDCDPVDTDVLAGPLLAIAEAGVASAAAEHEAQVDVEGVKAASQSPGTASQSRKRQVDNKAAFKGAEADTDALEATVRERAETASLTLSSGLATSASKKAAAISALEPEAAATLVREHLEGLSDAALTEQLGGATQQAYNAGRFSYMDAAGPKELYASEILDGNTCTACNGVDGTEYDSMAALREDYPVGGYVGCLAGLRCRGTGVAVY